MPFFENILLFYNDQFSGIKSEVIQLVRKNQAKLKIIDVFDNLDQYYELLPPSISSFFALGSSLISSFLPLVLRPTIHQQNGGRVIRHVGL